MNKSNSPIFIGGVPGSGTTMLVNTLDKHKNLSGYDETHLAIILEIMDNKLLSSDSELYARYLSRYITEKEILESIRNFAASLLRIKVIKDGKRRWVEKTPTNFLYWKLWKKIFHTTRTALSQKNKQV